MNPKYFMFAELNVDVKDAMSTLTHCKQALRYQHSTLKPLQLLTLRERLDSQKLIHCYLWMENRSCTSMKQ